MEKYPCNITKVTKHALSERKYLNVFKTKLIRYKITFHDIMWQSRHGQVFTKLITICVNNNNKATKVAYKLRHKKINFKFKRYLIPPQKSIRFKTVPQWNLTVLS